MNKKYLYSGFLVGFVFLCSLVIIPKVSADDSVPPPDTTITSQTTDTTSSTDISSDTSTVSSDPTVTDDQSTTVSSDTTTTGAPAVTTETPDTTTTDTTTTNSQTADPISAVTPVTSPTLSTDQADYAPGSIVTVVGHFFSSLGNFVLHLIGTNPDGTQSTEATQNVTSDSNGDFTTTFTLENIFRPFYNLFATDASGTTVASTNFTDNIGYDKSGYDKGTATWGTGNQSGYSENDWVQYQYTITGVNSGTIPDFNVVFDEQISGVIFIDGFTNFRVALDQPEINGTSVLANGVSEPPVSTTIWKTFTPGNINAAYSSGTCGVAEAVNTPAASHCFSVSGAALATAIGLPATGTHTVTIYYEAHMAASYVWSTGHEGSLGNTGTIYGEVAPAAAVPANTIFGTNVYSGWTTTTFKGAGGITGSAKHFTLQDQSAGPKGSIALPIPAVTLPTGSIKIIKVTSPSPAVGVSFPFNSDFGPFTLDTDPSATFASSTTFTQLPAGTYNFSEGTEPNNWNFTSVVCSPSVTPNGTSVSISLTSGSSVSCTYTNTKNQALPSIATSIHDAGHNVVTSVPAGTTVHDSVSVSGGNGTATGNVTFDWFTNGSCTLPSSATSGSVALSGGSADATGFPQGPLGVGSYSFLAHYSGDANYSAGDAPCESLTVTKISPTIATNLSASSVNVGTAVHDSSTLSGATTNAGGTVTYHAYAGANTCSGPDLLNSQVNVTNAVVPNSADFTPSAAGTYSFQAVYSGDANNNGGTSLCSSEQLTVNKKSPLIATLLSQSSVNIGSSVNDSATLTGATTNAGGTVTYTAYTNNVCSAGAQTGGTVNVTNGSVPNSNSIVFNTAGDYYWQAVYSGDANNAGVTSNCTGEHLVVSKGTTVTATTLKNVAGDATIINGTSVPLGTSVYDTTTVTPTPAGTPTGTVTYQFYSAAACSGSHTDETVTLSGGNVPKSGNHGPLGAGDYGFVAVYSGDSNYSGSTGICEPFTVSKAQLGITTTVHNTAHGVIANNAHVALGTKAHDNANVTGGVSGFPLPAITFSFDGGAISNGSTESGFDATSVVTNALTAGNHKFNATVASNANYIGATSADEPFVVDKGQLSVSTTIHNAQHNPVTSAALGSVVHDTANVSGQVSGITPTGAVTFTFDKSPNACGTTAIGNNGTESGNARSADTGNLSAGSYNFRAVVAGDDNYLGATSDCEPLTVNKADSSLVTTIHNDQEQAVTSVSLGSTVHDKAHVGGGVGSIVPTGNVTFTWYPNNVCIPEGTSAGSIAIDANGDAHPSTSEGPLAAGSYSFRASYAGDDNFNSSNADCEPLTVNKAQLSISTKVHDSAHTDITNGSIDLGSKAHDTATITGGVSGFPTPEITFTFDGGAIGNGSEGGFDAASVETAALGAGPHHFNATVAGDNNYIGATSADEPFSVNKAKLSITTTVHDGSHNVITNNAHVPLGTNTHDNANVSGAVAGFPIPAISFTFQSNPAANGAAESGFDATSVASGNLGAGSYVYNASVASDSNYDGATSADEPFTVDKAQLAITTTVHDVDHKDITNGNVAVGGTAHDNATVTGGVNGFAIPAVTFTFDGNPISNAVFAEGGFSATTVATDPLTVGGHTFNASVPDNDNYIGAQAAAEPFGVVNAKIEIGSSATNEVGQPHTFTVTVSQDTGSGFAGVQNVKPTVTFSPSNPGTVTDNCVSTGTDASGKCTVVINSVSAGVFTAHGTLDLTVNGVLFHLATNGTAPNSSDAVKTYIDANISIDPLTPTNNIGTPHTFTVTVKKNPGSGFVAANGEHVDFTLTNGGGANAVLDAAASTCDDAGPNTDVNGQCKIVFNSATPGTVTVHATVSLVMGGVTLNRATGDTKVGDSVDAVKTYVAGNLDLTKMLNVTPYSPLPLTLVDGTFTFHIIGPSFLLGHDESFTMTDGVITSTNPIHLTNLIPGSYTVTENDPGIAWAATTLGPITVNANQTASASITNTIKAPHTTISISSNTQETAPGENVILTITDKNDGAVPLNNPTVALTGGSINETLSNVPSAHCTAGVESGTVNGIMDVNESWTWTCILTVSSDTTFNIAGHGLDSLGTDVSPANGVTTEAGNISVKVVSTTRTLGFWQTHTIFTTSIFNTKGPFFVGSNIPVAIGTHKGVLTTAGQIFAGFYAPIAKTSTGAKRTAGDQARIQLLQQLLAAKLNCAAFGCGSTTQTLISQADAAYAGGDKNTIMPFVDKLDAYNNSGDNGAIPVSLGATGKATPKDSQALAGGTFWDTP